MQVFLSSGLELKPFHWKVKKQLEGDRFSLLCLTDDADGPDIHIAGLTADQLHALVGQILANVPWSVPPVALEPDEPFPDVLSNPASAGT